MARIELRNAHNIVIGWRQDAGDIIEARNKWGIAVGWYERKFDQTKGRNGRFIGRGDMLAALIVNS